MDTDHRPVVLLNLFFFESQFCGECGVEVLFKTQRIRSPAIYGSRTSYLADSAIPKMPRISAYDYTIQHRLQEECPETGDPETRDMDTEC